MLFFILPVPVSVVVHRWNTSRPSCFRPASFDLPAVKMEVTEHRSEEKQCPCCHYKDLRHIPKGVTKRHNTVRLSRVSFCIWCNTRSFLLREQQSFTRHLWMRTLRRHTQELDCRSPSTSGTTEEQIKNSCSKLRFCMLMRPGCSARTNYTGSILFHRYLYALWHSFQARKRSNGWNRYPS